MPFPLPEACLLAAENLLGAALPQSYRQLMLRSNGGELEAVGDSWELYPVADSTDRKRLSRTINHVIRETAELRQWPGFPENALAIGSNGCGDQLVLLRQGDIFTPQVYQWSHETGDLVVVANDFADLRG